MGRDGLRLIPENVGNHDLGPFRREEPRFGLPLLEPPGGEPQVDAVGRGEIGERQGRHLLVEPPDALGERRLRDTRRAQRARQHDPRPIGAVPLREPRQDLLRQ